MVHPYRTIAKYPCLSKYITKKDRQRHSISLTDKLTLEETNEIGAVLNSEYEFGTSLDQTTHARILATGRKNLYTAEYIAIYNEEKKHRNLKGRDHLIKLEKTEIETIDYTPSISPLEPKHSDIFSFDLKKIEEFMIDTGYHKYICFAGGLALSTFSGTVCNSHDIDLFFHSCTEEKATEILLAFQKKFTPRTSRANTACVEFGFQSGNVEFVKRIFNSKSECIHSFDIDCCCIMYDFKTKSYYGTKRFMYAYQRKVNTLNFERLSGANEARLMKYAKRGYGVDIPLFDLFKENFTFNLKDEEDSSKIIMKYMINNDYTCKIDSRYDNLDITLRDFDFSVPIKFIACDPSKSVTGMFDLRKYDNIKDWYYHGPCIDLHIDIDHLDDISTMRVEDLLKSDVKYRNIVPKNTFGKDVNLTLFDVTPYNGKVVLHGNYICDTLNNELATIRIAICDDENFDTTLERVKHNYFENNIIPMLNLLGISSDNVKLENVDVDVNRYNNGKQEMGINVNFVYDGLKSTNETILIVHKLKSVTDTLEYIEERYNVVKDSKDLIVNNRFLYTFRHDIESTHTTPLNKIPSERRTGRLIDFEEELAAIFA